MICKNQITFMPGFKKIKDFRPENGGFKTDLDKNKDQLLQLYE